MASFPPGQNFTQLGLRRAKFSELPQISRMLAESFKDEALFGRHIHLHQDRYPHDSALYWLRRLQRDYFSPNEVFLITVDDSAASRGGSMVTGLAQWSRKGPQQELQKFGWAMNGWWDIRRLLCRIASTYANICSWLFPNRAAERSREFILEESEHFTKHYWTGDRSSHWYLHLLGVHPAYQNKGIGRALVAWGIDQARKEGVACSVVAAADKDNFYQKCGFDTHVGNVNEGDDNPLKAVAGGNIWFRDFHLDTITLKGE